MSHLYRIFAFGLGALVILLVLSLAGRVGGNAMGCSEGLDSSVVYPAYEATSYGWPLEALLVEWIGCEGPPEQWATPRTVVTWYPLGIVVSVLEVLIGGLIGYVIGGGWLRL